MHPGYAKASPFASLEFTKNYVFDASHPLRGASWQKAKSKDPACAGSIFVFIPPLV